MGNNSTMVPEQEILALLDEMDRIWLSGKPRELEPFFHTDLVMAFPGSVRTAGKKIMIEGFVDFCENAKVHSYAAGDRQVDVIGSTAVATFLFDMTYERDGGKYKSTGRDLWVFARDLDRWQAVWRTMLDMNEEPVEA